MFDGCFDLLRYNVCSAFFLGLIGARDVNEIWRWRVKGKSLCEDLGSSMGEVHALTPLVSFFSSSYATESVLKITTFDRTVLG